tara:strand:+ start:262 stop:837 length:576 start_codon:yes stop_codon:yes gene_type:complete
MASHIPSFEDWINEKYTNALLSEEEIQQLEDAIDDDFNEYDIEGLSTELMFHSGEADWAASKTIRFATGDRTIGNVYKLEDLGVNITKKVIGMLEAELEQADDVQRFRSLVDLYYDQSAKLPIGGFFAMQYLKFLQWIIPKYGGEEGRYDKALRVGDNERYIKYWLSRMNFKSIELLGSWHAAGKLYYYEV